MNKKHIMWISGVALALILMVSVYLPRSQETQASGHSPGESSSIDPAMQAGIASADLESTDGMSAGAVAGEDGLNETPGEPASVQSGLPARDRVASRSSSAAGSEGDFAVTVDQGATREAEAIVEADVGTEAPSPKRSYAGHGGGGRAVAEILEGVDLSNDAERARVVAEMTAAAWRRLPRRGRPRC